MDLDEWDGQHLGSRAAGPSSSNTEGGRRGGWQQIRMVLQRLVVLSSQASPHRKVAQQHRTEGERVARGGGGELVELGNSGQGHCIAWLDPIGLSLAENLNERERDGRKKRQAVAPYNDSVRSSRIDLRCSKLINLEAIPGAFR
ncbi:hypothetical protein Taro_047375 [Colocasia esculenta]|uniref:Uncharacterized protein n=1 Tax=Colocasia esculenta TaxID=4460 RepID=A0A843X5D0_COLES|nr:hypothetical protein [Colocasia esculenta]